MLRAADRDAVELVVARETNTLRSEHEGSPAQANSGSERDHRHPPKLTAYLYARSARLQSARQLAYVRHHLP